jgi:hypothetical protein
VLLQARLPVADATLRVADATLRCGDAGTVGSSTLKVPHEIWRRTYAALLGIGTHARCHIHRVAEEAVEAPAVAKNDPCARRKTEVKKTEVNRGYGHCTCLLVRKPNLCCT